LKLIFIKLIKSTSIDLTTMGVCHSVKKQVGLVESAEPVVSIDRDGRGRCPHCRRTFPSIMDHMCSDHDVEFQGEGFKVVLIQMGQEL
jgi:hypothetical protein